MFRAAARHRLTVKPSAACRVKQGGWCGRGLRDQGSRDDPRRLTCRFGSLAGQPPGGSALDYWYPRAKSNGHLAAADRRASGADQAVQPAARADAFSPSRVASPAPPLPFRPVFPSDRGACLRSRQIARSPASACAVPSPPWRISVDRKPATKPTGQRSGCRRSTVPRWCGRVL